MVAAMLALGCGCAAISGGISGENQYGLMDLHFAEPKFAPDDPLKFCLDNPSSCAKKPIVACRTEEIGGATGSFSNSLGGPVDCLKPTTAMGTPGKSYDVVLDVQCYEPVVVQRVILDKPWTGRFDFSQTPFRRFLQPDTLVGRFPKDLQNEPSRRGGWTEAPPLTEIEVLRDWPLSGSDEKCMYSVARVVDAAGVIEPGALVIVPKKGLLEVRPEGQTVASQLAARTAEKEQQAAAQKEAATKAGEAARATSEQESKSGRCTDERSAFMQRVLSNFKRLMETNKFTLASNHIVVAGGAPLRLRTSLAGEYHVFALAFDEAMKLQVRDATGQAAALKSPYAGISRSVTDAALDSAVFEGNAVSNFTVAMTGKGCSLVTVFYKYGE